MLHHIVPKKIGKQDQQVSASRQAILFALVGAVAAGEVAVNFNAVAAEHGGDIAQGVGSDQHGLGGVHGKLLL